MSNASDAIENVAKITFDSENWDTDNLFASNKFTATDAGKYFFTANFCLLFVSKYIINVVLG